MCRDCAATYIGQTKRKLHTGIKEHRNNIKLSSNNLSVVSAHRLEFEHEFLRDNVNSAR